jgi:hypothetical protein
MSVAWIEIKRPVILMELFLSALESGIKTVVKWTGVYFCLQVQS